MVLKYNEEGFPYEDKESADLEERIEQLEKQKEILKAACKKAGETIKTLSKVLKTLTKRAQEAEGELTIIKGIGNTSPEMKALQAEVENLKADLARAREDHQFDNMVHKKELNDRK